MKRTLLLACLLALFPALSHAQFGNIGLAYATGSAAPSACNAPALFFPNNGSAPAYCNGNPGTFVTFGTSTGAAITGSPVAGQLAKFTAANSISNGDLLGDCTTAGSLSITCTKTNGVAFATSATTNTTNASNITSGTLPLARLPLSGNGSTLATVSGTLTGGNCIQADVNQNLVASGGACGTAGTAVPINVANASPGSSSIGACTLTFTNGLNTVTSSSKNCFSAANIGSILEYNKAGGASCAAAVVARTPCFRAVITGVTNGASSDTITLGAGGYFPDATSSGIGLGSGAGTYDLVASDICAQSNATLAVNGGVRADAGSINGTPNCTLSPWNGLDYANGGWGIVQWASGTISTTTQIFLPQRSTLQGTGKGSTGNNTNTLISASTGVNGYAAQTFEANGTTSTNFASTSGSVGFSDQPPAGSCSGTDGQYSASNNCNLVVAVVKSAACIAGTQYGQFQMEWALQGFKEASQINFVNVTNWNGTWALVETSGLNGIVQFSATCTAPTITNNALNCAASCSTANLAVNNDILASWPVTLAGTVTASQNGSTGQTCNSVQNLPCWIVTDTSSDFLPADTGSAVIGCSGCAGNKGPYTIVEETGGTTVNIQTPTSAALSWSGATAQMTRYVESEISALSSFNATSQAMTFTTILPMQETCSACGTVTEYIGGPVLNFANFSTANGNSIQGSNYSNLVVQCNNIIGCGDLSADAGQEQGSLDHLGLSGWTTYAIRCEFNCAHHGPWTTIQGGSAGVGTVAPTAAAVFYVETSSGQTPRLIEGMTFTSNANGVDPFACFEISGNAASFMNDHCERYGVNFNIGRYPGISSSRGLQFLGNDTGIGSYEAYWIHSGGSQKADGIISGWNTNTPGDSFIRDDNTYCGIAGSKYFDGASASPGIAFYQFSTSSTPATHFSSDLSTQAAAGQTATPPNCTGGTSTNIQALGNVGGGTATANMNLGNVITMTLTASVATFTVNNSATGQMMDLTIQENAGGTFTFAFPANFKGFTAITTTGNQCNVYHAFYDGTNWVATAAVNTFAGPCL